MSVELLLIVSATAAPLAHDAVFSDALQMRTDRLLEGVLASTSVEFPVPAEWQLTADPVLRLDYETSSALLPERSHLAVVLNGQPLASVPLRDESQLVDELAVPLPRALLTPWNRLELRAVHHVSTHCEDPFDPSLWTRLRNRSSIAFLYERRAVEPDLAAWPYPWFDETGFGPALLTLVTGDRPSTATLDAVGVLGLSLGRQAAWRGLEVTEPVVDVREARTHAIVVGLPDENPHVAALLGDLRLGGSQGLVAALPNPADPSLAVLVVTGGDAAGLREAAHALAGRNRAEILSGSRVLVEHASDASPPRNRMIPRAAPERDSFSFADLGLDDQTVHGFHTPTLRVPLGLRGDAVVRPGGAEVILEYGYAARLDPGLSALEVRLDGVTVRTVPLDDPEGASRKVVAVDLPETAIEPDSRLEVVFHLFPRDFDACHYSSDATLWGTVYASSALRLERDHAAELPDLGRLRYGAWPFTLDPSSGGVVIALSDAPTPGEVGVGFRTAAWLGSHSPADEPALRLVSASDLGFDGAPQSHFVVVATDAAHALRDRLASRSSLAAGGPQRRLVDQARQLLMGISGDGALGGIEGLLHPANDERAVLLLHAADTEGLDDLLDALTTRVDRMAGTLAMVGPEGRIRTLDLAERRPVGGFTSRAALQHALRRNWIFLGLGMVAGGLVFSVVKAAWARRRGGA